MPKSKFLSNVIIVVVDVALLLLVILILVAVVVVLILFCSCSPKLCCRCLGSSAFFIVMSHFVWIVSYPHGARRYWQDGKRKHCVLPQVVDAPVGQQTTGIIMLYVVALALIAPGVAYTGPFTVWSRQCKILHEYFHQSVHAYSVEVSNLAGCRTVFGNNVSPSARSTSGSVFCKAFPCDAR